MSNQKIRKKEKQYIKKNKQKRMVNGQPKKLNSQEEVKAEVREEEQEKLRQISPNKIVGIKLLEEKEEVIELEEIEKAKEENKIKIHLKEEVAKVEVDLAREIKTMAPLKEGNLEIIKIVDLDEIITDKTEGQILEIMVEIIMTKEVLEVIEVGEAIMMISNPEVIEVIEVIEVNVMEEDKEMDEVIKNKKKI